MSPRLKADDFGLPPGWCKSSDRELKNSSKSLQIGNISTSIGLFFPVDEITLTPVMVLTYSDPASPKEVRIAYSNTK
jgi:hypothetical protein